MNKAVFLLFLMLLLKISSALNLELEREIYPPGNITLEIEVKNNLSVGVLGTMELKFNNKVGSYRISLMPKEAVKLNFPITAEKLGEKTLEWKFMGEKGKLIFKVSNLPIEVKQLIEYYQGELEVQKLRIEKNNLSLNTEKIENKIKEAEKLNEEGKYMDAGLLLREVADLIFQTEKEIVKEVKRKEIAENVEIREIGIREYIFLIIPIFLTAALLLIFRKAKIFIPALRKSNIEELKNAHKHIGGKSLKSKLKLEKRIKKVEEKIKELELKDKGDLEKEMALIKKKFNHGMYEICTFYLDSLEEKLEKSEG